MNEIMQAILDAYANIDGAKRRSIEDYFAIGVAYNDGVKAELWESQRGAVAVFETKGWTVALSYIQRGCKIVEHFGSVAAAQRSFDKAPVGGLTTWLSSLDGEKGAPSTLVLNRAQKKAAQNIVNSVDFAALPTKAQQKIAKVLGVTLD